MRRLLLFARDFCLRMTEVEDLSNHHRKANKSVSVKEIIDNALGIHEYLSIIKSPCEHLARVLDIFRSQYRRRSYLR